MAKKNEVAVPTTQELSMPSTLTPANVVGMNTSKMQIDPANLPEHLRGVTFEVIETGFAPTVKWTKEGEYVAGAYVRMEQGVGPNKANLYTFDAQGKEFGVWGTTVLDRAMEKAIERGQIKPGYMVMITFVASLPSDYEVNPTKLFHIGVVKK